MSGKSSFRHRALRHPVRLLRLCTAATVFGLSIAAALTRDNAPLPQRPAQSPPAASAAFTYPGPQVLYAAP